ncbi:MAG: hypothetical protein ACRC37_08370 [Lentisphaeria bacterium]
MMARRTLCNKEGKLDPLWLGLMVIEANFSLKPVATMVRSPQAYPPSVLRIKTASIGALSLEPLRAYDIAKSAPLLIATRVVIRKFGYPLPARIKILASISPDLIS